jgi:hypothetical protein
MRLVFHFGKKFDNRKKGTWFKFSKDWASLSSAFALFSTAMTTPSLHLSPIHDENSKAALLAYSI